MGQGTNWGHVSCTCGLTRSQQRCGQLPLCQVGPEPLISSPRRLWDGAQGGQRPCLTLTELGRSWLPGALGPPHLPHLGQVGDLPESWLVLPFSAEDTYLTQYHTQPQDVRGAGRPSLQTWALKA